MRPVKHELTDERRRVVVAVVAAGGTLEQAAMATAVPRSSLYTWLRSDSALAEAVEGAKREHAQHVAEAAERARAGRPAGSLHLVPAGPGSEAQMAALRRAELARRGAPPTPKAEAAPRRRTKSAWTPRDNRPSYAAATLRSAVAGAFDAAASWLDSGHRHPRSDAYGVVHQAVHAEGDPSLRESMALRLLESVEQRWRDERDSTMSGRVALGPAWREG